MKIKLFSSICIATFLLLTGCNSKEKRESTKTTHKSQTDNRFNLQPIDSNETVVLKKGKDGLTLLNEPKRLLLIDIFATWCPPCRAEAEVLSNIQKKFPKQVKIIGVTIENSIEYEKLATFAHTYNAHYTLVTSSANEKVIDKVSSDINIGSRFPIPLMVIYKDGKVYRHYEGATEEEFIVSDIKQALE